MSERTGSAPPREVIGSQQWLADFLEAAPGACAVVTAVRDEQGALIDVQIMAANSGMREHLGLVGGQVPGYSLMRTDAELLDSLARVLESGAALVQPDVGDSTGAPGAMRMRWTRVDDNTLRADLLEPLEEQTQQELERQRQYVQAVLASELNARVLVEPRRDSTGELVDLVCVEANPEALAYLDASGTQAIGSRIVDILPGLEGSAHLEALSRTLDTGEPLIIDDAKVPAGGDRQARSITLRAIAVHGALSITWREVTDESMLARQLAESEELFQIVATSTSDVIALGNLQGILQWVSPSLTRVLGWAPEQWVGQRARDFIHPEDQVQAQTVRAEIINGTEAALRMRLRDVNGGYHWAESRGAPFIDGSGQTQGMLATVTLIDKQVAWENELRQAATHDPLTGLLTRSEAYRHLAVLRHQEGPTDGATFLAFIDVDNLKPVNDRLGHVAGDEPLQVVARRIRESLREGDQAARVGGDEFLLMLPGIRETDAAVGLMQRLLDAINRPHRSTEGLTLHPSMSIGLARIKPGEDMEEAMRRSDAAMYQAKLNGGNRVHVAR